VNSDAVSSTAAGKPAVAGFQQTTTDETTKAVKVSLQDCLACSGCVTTAETMLLQQQSTEELLTQLKQPHVDVVASVSPQSIASLAAAYNLSVHRVRLLILAFSHTTNHPLQARCLSTGLPGCIRCLFVWL
jgi:iron only hydrogenase large subunit-like protein